ncbi:MAG TPA: hypothetical protein DEP29_06520 [Bifidobacterium sp.]|nr:hypothetical protein [Bifidobacterium sp.]
MSSRPILAEVARKANVSISTASKALTGKGRAGRGDAYARIRR